MSFIHVSDIKPKEIVPGFYGRFVHSENITIAYWDIKKGATIPTHQHINEMVVNVISGSLELTIANETRVITGGMAAVIPANVPHKATGITDCQVIDVFYPLRKEYQNE
jgi:quercetin dioxygenase-like cupin family protein